MSAQLSLLNVRWSAADGRAVLSDLSVTFGTERTGVVGRDGVGKSTLLALLAGRLRPSGGSVVCDGTVALLRPAEAGAGEADEFATADWTLEERLAGALVMMGVPVEPATPLSRLSGGQRARAALAAAIFARPKFLLLDEPTNDLDSNGRRAVHEAQRRDRGPGGAGGEPLPRRLRRVPAGLWGALRGGRARPRRGREAGGGPRPPGTGDGRAPAAPRGATFPAFSLGPVGTCRTDSRWKRAAGRAAACPRWDRSGADA